MRKVYGILICALLVGNGPAVADPFGVRIQGTWTGKGMVREYPDQPEQSGRCKLTVTGEASGLVFTLNGKCATARRAGKMKFSFNRSASSTAVTAVGSSTVAAGKVTYTGQMSDTNLEMRAGKEQRIGARSYLNTVRISMTKANRFHLEMDAQDVITDKVRTIINMDFERK